MVRGLLCRGSSSHTTCYMGPRSPRVCVCVRVFVCASVFASYSIVSRESFAGSQSRHYRGESEGARLMRILITIGRGAWPDGSKRTTLLLASSFLPNWELKWFHYSRLWTMKWFTQHSTKKYTEKIPAERERAGERENEVIQPISACA